MDENRPIKRPKDLDPLFQNLANSAFRSRFKLDQKERQYLVQAGVNKVLEEAKGFLATYLTNPDLANEGKQPPFRGHPAHVAQHATAFCCRKCLENWHGIPKGHTLTYEELEYGLDVIRRWLEQQLAT